MREKILVLEDDHNFRQMVVESLEDLDLSLHIVDVEGPELAIEASRNTRFDLMITDVRMAGATDGLGALEQVKKHCPAIYSIVMTGYMHEDRPEVRAMKVGTDFFLSKPFSLNKFSNAVLQVLATKHSNDTLQQQVKDFFNSARRALMRRLSPQEEEARGKSELESGRDLFFNAFFTAIQTTNLQVSSALQVWDHLVELEREYESLVVDVGEQASELAQKYRALFDLCASLTEKRQGVTIGARGADQISKELFGQFHQRVLDGEVSRPYLQRAPAVWLLQGDIKKKLKSPPDSRNWPRLLLQIFGEDPLEKSQREQQRLQEERQQRQKSELQRLTSNLENSVTKEVAPPVVSDRLDSKNSHEDLAAERLRHRVLSQYAQALQRSQLTLFGALWTWDQLISLEKAYAEFRRGGSVAPFERLRGLVARLAADRVDRPIAPRAPYQISTADFTALCRLFCQGRVGAEEFQQAPRLWFTYQMIRRRLKANFDQPEDSILYQKLFGGTGS